MYLSYIHFIDIIKVKFKKETHNNYIGKSWKHKFAVLYKLDT